MLLTATIPHPTLHDCPCPGTPTGLDFKSRTFSSKMEAPPATGSIELDFTGAVNGLAHAVINVETTGCYCMAPLTLDICLPKEGFGTEEGQYPDLGAFLKDYFQSHWSINAFTEWTIVGAPTATKAKLNWVVTMEGLHPNFTFVRSGYMDVADNGITGATTNSDPRKISCGKYHCAEPVGVNQCSQMLENYTDSNKDDLLFMGVVMKALCGQADCCSSGCSCPPVRVLTQGETPLPTDPTVKISPTANNLVWDVVKRSYSLLTTTEVATMSADSVLLTTHASFDRCCKTQPNAKIFSFGL